MKLIDDFDFVLKRAWSVRLMLIAAGLSGLEVMLSVMAAYGVRTALPPGVLAAISGLVTVGAFVARFVAQPRD